MTYQLAFMSCSSIFFLLSPLSVSPSIILCHAQLNVLRNGFDVDGQAHLAVIKQFASPLTALQVSVTVSLKESFFHSLSRSLTVLTLFDIGCNAPLQTQHYVISRFQSIILQHYYYSRQAFPNESAFAKYQSISTKFLERSLQEVKSDFKVSQHVHCFLRTLSSEVNASAVECISDGTSKLFSRCLLMLDRLSQNPQRNRIKSRQCPHPSLNPAVVCLLAALAHQPLSMTKMVRRRCPIKFP
jgi:hypothetical protein